MRELEMINNDIQWPEDNLQIRQVVVQQIKVHTIQQRPHKYSTNPKNHREDMGQKLAAKHSIYLNFIRHSGQFILPLVNLFNVKPIEQLHFSNYSQSLYYNRRVREP